jgi:hypothetical protein
MKAARSWFKSEAFWIVVFSLAPLALGLLIALVFIIMR